MKAQVFVAAAVLFTSFASASSTQAPTASKNTGCLPGGQQAAPSGPHAYFESLASRPDCKGAYSLRDEQQLGSFEATAASRKNTSKKKPIAYDPAMDAARVSIYAPSTTDSQQKFIPVKAKTGTLLMTWDFRFDGNFAWKKGYVKRHKTWRFDPGPWLAMKTDYQKASKAGKLAELFLSSNSKQWLGPGTTRLDREILSPRKSQFYIQADTWTRAWIFVEDLDKPVSYVSFWAADANQGLVQLYDRIAIIPPPAGIDRFRIEYDTSGDRAQNPKEMHSWNRNIVILQGLAAADVKGLLKPPAK